MTSPDHGIALANYLPSRFMTGFATFCAAASGMAVAGVNSLGNNWIHPQPWVSFACGAIAGVGALAGFALGGRKDLAMDEKAGFDPHNDEHCRWTIGGVTAGWLGTLIISAVIAHQLPPNPKPLVDSVPTKAIAR
jgi:hypothetical protein